MDSERNGHVTLRAIAEKAGVSRMTVSRALRDDPTIAIETRERVRVIARQLGYRPDPRLARVMAAVRDTRRSVRSEVIAYLTAHERKGGWREHASQRLCFEGAARRAADCGYRLEEFWSREPGMTDARLSGIIHARGIEGVLIAPLPAPDPVFGGIRWEHFAAVGIGYSLLTPALHRVCCHHFQSVMLVSRELHAAGYRRIGLAMSEESDERVRHHWRAAHLASHSLVGSVDGMELMFLSPDLCRESLGRWIERVRPDAIITIGPSVGRWLRDLGHRVPEDIGLANVDVALDAPGTTGIDQSPEQIGTAAVDLLTSLIHHGERGLPAVPRVTKVHGTFVRGRTTQFRSPACGSDRTTEPLASGRTVAVTR